LAIFVSFRRLKHRRAKALIDFERHEDDELGFRKNDLITVRMVYQIFKNGGCDE